MATPVFWDQVYKQTLISVNESADFPSGGRELKRQRCRSVLKACSRVMPCAGGSGVVPFRYGVPGYGMEERGLDSHLPSPLNEALAQSTAVSGEWMTEYSMG